MTMQIVITGVEHAQRRLEPGRFEKGLRAGLQEAGDLVGSEARRVVEPHHFTGRFEQNIHTEIGGHGLGLQARVGVSAGKVPEARPLTFGWRSSGGKQPPTDAIAEWLARKPEISPSQSSFRTSKGFVRTRRGSGGFKGVAGESAVRSMAFLIARAIGRRGFSFGSGQGGQKLDTFTRALSAVGRGTIGRVIAKHLGQDR